MTEFECAGLKGLARVPKDFNKETRYPVLIYLHGAGTRGNNIEVLKSGSFFRITEEYCDFPFISVAPLCNADSWFVLLSELKRLVKAIADDERTDESRIYLIGNSMGGYATWQLAMNNPQYFAAIVPICGGGMYWNAERLKHIPIWAHHGNKDERVDVSESIKMVDAICKKGGNAKLTIYEGVGHNCWDATYKNPEVFHWLLENVNENPPVITSDYHDSKLYG